MTYTHNGEAIYLGETVVPPEHVAARLNELARLQDAFQRLANAMYPVWALEGGHQWAYMMPYLIVDSTPEKCTVKDLVDHLLLNP